MPAWKLVSRGGPHRLSIFALWRADAIVLFDWLMSTDLNAVPITHPAQKQALTDLLARLEEVDVTESTEEEIAAAQDEVAKNMGW
ncbi:hypothetical protein JQK87_00465 [Streptomyces sp. G44]|uniref:hypothetical protein n=1 Tax=Streptomyces sp. G44 TaxID=2807632 RepID=UPI0019616A51|nr:hypothetical protein [Streptomyces sp. G44]MBM7166924.1 hypothetical protein [Streptomyces sp. G44]